MVYPKRSTQAFNFSEKTKNGDILDSEKIFPNRGHYKNIR